MDGIRPRQSQENNQSHQSDARDGKLLLTLPCQAKEAPAQESGGNVKRAKRPAVSEAKPYNRCFLAMSASASSRHVT